MEHVSLLSLYTYKLCKGVLPFSRVDKFYSLAESLTCLIAVISRIVITCCSLSGVIIVSLQDTHSLCLCGVCKIDQVCLLVPFETVLTKKGLGFLPHCDQHKGRVQEWTSR